MKALYNISSKILKSLIIISTILFLQVNTTFAEGNTINPSVTLSMNTLLSILAPTTPATSDFSDAELNLSDIETLAPVVPSEAGFGDSDEIKINMNYLALDVPAEVRQGALMEDIEKALETLARFTLEDFEQK